MHRVPWRCWCDDQTYYKVLRHSQLILGFIWFRSGLGFIVIQDDSGIVRLNKLTSTWGTTFEAGHCMTSNKRRVSVCPRKMLAADIKDSPWRLKVAAVAWLITGGFFVCDIIYIYICMYVCTYLLELCIWLYMYMHEHEPHEHMHLHSFAVIAWCINSSNYVSTPNPTVAWF